MMLKKHYFGRFCVIQKFMLPKYVYRSFLLTFTRTFGQSCPLMASLNKRQRNKGKKNRGKKKERKEKGEERERRGNKKEREEKERTVKKD